MAKLELHGSSSSRQAEIALCGYKRQGFAADSHNPDHIAAYVALRQVSQRISPAMFMDYLRKQVKEMHTGVKVFTHYWGGAEE